MLSIKIRVIDFMKQLATHLSTTCHPIAGLVFGRFLNIEIFLASYNTSCISWRHLGMFQMNAFPDLKLFFLIELFYFTS